MSDGKYPYVNQGYSNSNWSSQMMEKKHNTSALVILHRGRIVAERCWDATDAMINQRHLYQDRLLGHDDEGRPIEDVSSVGKSVVAFLVAIARSRGLVDIDTPVSKYLKEGWSAAPPAWEQRIQVRHLLSMSSGLSTELRFETEAGTKWLYNTRAYTCLLEILTQASGMTPARYTNEWLTGPIGMADSKWQARPWVTPSPLGFGTSARDLARFGLLVLADGIWDKHQILGNADYLRESLRPSQEMNSSYGFLWWVNASGSFIPTAPKDLVAASGTGDRKLYIVPSFNLVVTRLGATGKFNEDGSWDAQFFDRELWALLMTAISPS
jgi:CubicO group peptidase (beta-lactamase class C family)